MNRSFQPATTYELGWGFSCHLAKPPVEVVLRGVCPLGKLGQGVGASQVVAYRVNDLVNPSRPFAAGLHPNTARIVKHSAGVSLTVTRMQQIIPYLAFPGTCAKAMKFYADVLGGKITTMTTLADSPISFPAEVGELIFNSEMRAGDLVLKASDNPEGGEAGSSISLFLPFSDTAERERVFSQLGEDGDILFALEGPFGMLRDKFGVQWMLVLTE